MEKTLILNLGSGDMGRQEGITNVDCRKLPNVDVVADVKKLPFGDNEIEGILNRNLIEHFGRNEIKPLLTEWVRVLKPGGFMRIETVDMGKLMDNWRSIPEENLLDGILGAQTYDENFHKMIFTKQILTRFLEEAGMEVKEVVQNIQREIPRIVIVSIKN
jgi:predicted SAM-dependent methyltransferase